MIKHLIKINDKEIEFTTDELISLKKELDLILDNKQITYMPCCPYNPVYPSCPYYYN